MTDAGTRVPMIVNWPAGIKKPGRVVDDLVEFCDVMPTLCEVTGSELPTNYPGDGSSIVPVLKDNAGARKKEWIYIWYRGQVMVRNKQYSLLAKTDGSDARLTRYKGPFDGEKLQDSALSERERAIKGQFEATLARLAKTRLSGVSKNVRAQVEKTKKKGKK
jgi:arylsulfatase A